MKRLLIKASGITNPSWRGYNSGVGRSTYMLLNSLAKIEKLPFEIEVYANGISSIGFDFYKWPFKHFSFPIPERYGCNKTKLEPYFRNHFVNYDLFHIPHNIDKTLVSEKYVVTFHDVIAYDNAIKQGNKELANYWLDTAQRAVGIMTCSVFSKKEIVEKLKVPDEKVSVVYWGTSIDKFYIEDNFIVQKKLEQLGIRDEYFVSISCANPRKNIRTLLKAFKKFLSYQPKHKLVLVWGSPPKDILYEYNNEITNKQIIFLDYVSDEELRILYNGASVTFFPTRAEGFGFPILESFACGTPIMTCRNTCLEEIGQDVAIYVGEDNIDEMCDVMRMFEDNEYDMDEFKQKSQLLIKKFSWDNTAKNYIDFYKKYL